MRFCSGKSFSRRDKTCRFIFTPTRPNKNVAQAHRLLSVKPSAIIISSPWDCATTTLMCCNKKRTTNGRPYCYSFIALAGRTFFLLSRTPQSNAPHLPAPLSGAPRRIKNALLLWKYEAALLHNLCKCSVCNS